MTFKALDLAIQHVGGVSELARRLGVRHNTVSMWRKRKSVPDDMCVAVEEATGGAITRYQLRPKTFGAAPAGDEQIGESRLPAGMAPSEGQ